MFTQNISFKNFLTKNKNIIVKKKLNLILKEKNQVIKSLSKSYKDSFSKKNIIANKEPKCKLISTNNELALISYKLETIIKCADELIGKNSDTPCTADRIRISIKS